MASPLAPPATLEVGVHTYDLDVTGKHIDHDYSGTHNAAKGLIEVDPGQPLDRQRVVSLHEVGHAVYAQTAWSNHQHKDDFTVTVEDALDNMMPGLLLVLRRNPAYVAWLMEGVATVTPL